jgi:type I restriction enzyme, R subunit
MSMTLDKEKQAVQDKCVQYLAGLSWQPVSEHEMKELRTGRMAEPLVEPLLVDALRKLNDISEQEALQVVDRLRRITDSESFLKALRDGLNMQLDSEKESDDIMIVDWRNPSRNTYVATAEFELKTGAIREPRLDVVCLVNGIPLGVIETKSPKDSWKKAARDFKTYWDDAPELERFVGVCVATNGWLFRVAASGARKTAQFAEWKDTWPHPTPVDGDDRELEVGLLGVLEPHNLVDISANFIVFENRENGTSKKLARYQQFRGANKVVNRVLNEPHDRGIVWHTQGSGKSLTMVFAARKLGNIGLERPTILIVIDRVDLDDQINETFTSVSFEGFERAGSRRALHEMLAGDQRGVIITTVQKFDESMESLADRENVIVLVDEAHRSQEGEFGIRMRAAMPKASLFAFTGTPIENDDRSTRKAFSPVIEGSDGKPQYENYLDIYTPKEAVEDGATVEVRYTPRLAEIAHFTGDDLDKSFEAFAEDLTEEEREKLKSDAARLAVIAHGDARVAAIAADAKEFLETKTVPQGFKAQFVAIDREACVQYAEEFLKLGLKREEIAVIFTANPKRDDDRYRRWYASEQWKYLSEHVDEDEQLVMADEDADEFTLNEAKAKKKVIAAFKNEKNPLKLLIVCDMLLTGFDAPVEQVMFLDKPLRGAKLLQAIMRTNRPAPGKDRGIVVDYWGVFEKLQEAFDEFNPDEVDLAVLDLQDLAARFPQQLAEALAMVAGLPQNIDEYEQMMWLRKRFVDSPEDAEEFEQRFQTVESSFESLMPDPMLTTHLADYHRLVALRAMWRHAARLDEDADDFDLQDYRPQTHQLVRDAVSVERLRRDLPVYRIDGSYLVRLDAAPGSPEEKAAEIETAIEFEIKQRGEDDVIARSLAQRLEKLRLKKEAADSDMLSLLDEFKRLARDWAAEKEAHESLGLSQRAQGFLSVSRAAAAGTVSEDDLVSHAKRLDELVVSHATFDEWAERDDVIRAIRHDLIKLLTGDPKLKPLYSPTLIDEIISVAVARQTAAA